MPGPVPKRSDQRRRRNEPDGPALVKAEAGKAPTIPRASGDSPETARRFARSVTLASIAADGESVPKSPEERTAEPCPNDNAPCRADCGARRDCHREAVVDLFRPAEPDTEHGEFTREELFLAARELAGPAAGLDDVLKVAAYLAA